jgi:hypothetical protein
MLELSKSFSELPCVIISLPSATGSNPLRRLLVAIDQPILLVGSIPGDDAEAVFRACGPALGEHVRAIPDGETGLRRVWVNFIAATVLNTHPSIRSVSQPKPVGSIANEWRTEAEAFVPSSFEDMWFFVVDPTVESIEFERLGYADHAIASYDIFKRLKGEGVISLGVRFQVSLPLAESAIRWFLAGKRDYDIVKPAYDAALKREIVAITEAIPPEDLLVQWDVCMEVLAAELDDHTGQPPLGYPLDGNPIERWETALSEMSPLLPEAVKLGLHLCYGDLGHAHMVEPADLARSVEMGNRGCLAAGRHVDYVHMAVPRDRKDSGYFGPLKNLDIGNTTLILGLVHHTDGEAGTRERIAQAKAVLPHFGIATECGFGRRPQAQIPDLLDIHCRVLDAL